MNTILPQIIEYFKTATTIDKIIDSIILVFICTGISMSLGWVPFHYFIFIAPMLVGLIAWSNHRYKQSQHSIENTCDLTRKVHRIISAEQYMNDFAFIGNFRFSNGATTLDQGFSFMKLSLTEYATKDGINIIPQRWHGLPIVINLSLIASLAEGKPYQGQIDKSSPMYSELHRANIKSYTAVPIYGVRRTLVGFLYVGSSTSTPPDIEVCTRIAEQIELI